MQLPAAFRRGIVAPCNAHARDELSTWFVNRPVRVQYIPIDDSVFADVWESGLFQAINSLCSSRIDDYEEECIDSSKLPSVIKLLNERKCGYSGSARVFADNLLELCQQASETDMPVFFIL